MTKPHFKTEYKQGPKAGFIDWIAGGNFDGFILQKSIEFIEENMQVVMRTKILDQSCYDGHEQDSECLGTFEYSNNNTITVTYKTIELRGKILGENREYIAFSVSQPRINGGQDEVYSI